MNTCFGKGRQITQLYCASEIQDMGVRSRPDSTLSLYKYLLDTRSVTLAIYSDSALAIKVLWHAQFKFGSLRRRSCGV